MIDSSQLVSSLIDRKVFYFNTVPIRVETVRKLHPRREVYRLNLEKCQELHGLPTVLVIKEMKDGWQEEFDQEKKAYRSLECLQGIVIPTFFGQGTFEDSPILILSEVIGITLYELAYSMVPVSLDKLRHQLEKALELVHSQGAEYLDQRLDNFFLCDTDQVMIVDLEQVRFPSDLEDWKDSVNYGGVGSLLYLFNDIRERKKESTR